MSKTLVLRFWFHRQQVRVAVTKDMRLWWGLDDLLAGVGADKSCLPDIDEVDEKVVTEPTPFGRRKLKVVSDSVLTKVLRARPTSPREALTVKRRADRFRLWLALGLEPKIKRVIKTGRAPFKPADFDVDDEGQRSLAVLSARVALTRMRAAASVAFVRGAKAWPLPLGCLQL